MTPIICGAIDVAIVNEVGSNACIEVFSNQIIVNCSDLSLKDEIFSFRAYPHMVDYASSDSIGSLININFDICKVTDTIIPVIDNVSYTIGDAPIAIVFEEFQSEEAAICCYQWTYQAFLDDLSPLPDEYFTFDSNSRILEISSTSGTP